MCENVGSHEGGMMVILMFSVRYRCFGSSCDCTDNGGNVNSGEGGNDGGKMV